MATPILQNISAFDVAKGTTISFTVLGTSTLIRSNKIVIYDSLTNDVVANNKQVNTSTLVNNIPANLSGISNGKQYYAIISIYSSTDCSGDALGVSSSASFWCLPEPTIDFTYPSVNTTTNLSSCNFICEYDTNYSGLSPIPSVQNKIQSYKFDLYLNGSLIKTSGNILGSGVLSDDVYILNYQFDGLENGNTYTSKCSVITERGMEIETTSPLISVSLENVGFSIAQATNKPCEGYIEIRNNVTNIVGYTNADFVIDSGHIDLTDEGDYVSWGINPEDDTTEYPLVFPTISVSGYTTTEWSLILKLKNPVTSNSNPFVSGDESYTLLMRELIENEYNKQNGIYLYLRQDYGETNLWGELYAIRDIANASTASIVKSNVLTGITSSTDIYILIRCHYGLYDVTFATSLPT